MRRMREIPWYYWSAVLPLIAIAFGIPYVVKKRYYQASHSRAVTVKPSAYRGDFKSAENSADLRGPIPELPKAIGSEFSGVGINNACVSFEFPGKPPGSIRISKADWGIVMNQYHEAKEKLLSWLEKNKKQFPGNMATVMEERVREMRIQRPPTDEEPDLSWRGIGAWTYDGQGNPLIRVGGGFVKLAVQQPARGTFELTRLLAQAWSPCYLVKVVSDQPWNPLLKCLGVEETQACEVGSYSEGAWAVSSAIAAVVAPPGCKIPAFESAEAKACLKKVASFSKTSAEVAVR